MKKQITRICILQSSKIVTTLYCLFGFIYTLIGIPMLVFGGEEAKVGVAIFMILGPVWLGIIGFVLFAIFAALYNIFAGWIGGFEVEITDVSDA